MNEHLRGRPIATALLLSATFVISCSLRVPPGLDGSPSDREDGAPEVAVDVPGDALRDAHQDALQDAPTDAPGDLLAEASRDVTSNDTPEDLPGEPVVLDAPGDSAARDALEVGFDVRPEVGLDAGPEVGLDVRIDVPADLREVGVDAAPVADIGLDIGPSSSPPTDLCMATPAIYISGVEGRTTYVGTTTGRANDYRGTCVNSSVSAPDVVYALRLARPQRVALVLTGMRATPAFDPVLYVSQDCTQRAVESDGTREREIACMNNLPAGGLNPSMTMVLPAGDYRLFVDGGSAGDAGNGPYTLSVDISPAEAPASIEIVTSGACMPAPVFVDIGPRTDDGLSPPQTIPFSFSWFGTPVSRCVASTNGFVQLLTSEPPDSAWANQVLPSSNRPNGVLAAWWDDLTTDGHGMGQIRVGTAGASPDRALVLRWRDADRYRDNQPMLDFEVRLMETSNAVEFHYCEMNFRASMTGRTSATIGVESLDGLGGATHILNADPAALTGKIIRFRAQSP